MAKALSLDLRDRDARPKRKGGDRRSGRIEAHAALILSLVEQTKDITIAAVQAKLAEQGLSFSIGTLWRFFDRHRITLKKVGARLRAGAPGCREAAAGLV